MENLKEIISKKEFRLKTSSRKGNPNYGVACELQKKLDIPLSICFRLLKKHTFEELQPLISWWADYLFKRKNNIGLLYWKLKQLYPEKYITKKK